MASPSEEARSRDNAREAQQAAEQTSVGTAYGTNSPQPLDGWKRTTSHQKDVPYASPGGPDSKR